MKLFKLKLESRKRANMIDDWIKPLFVVAQSMQEIFKKYDDIIEIQLINDEVHVLKSNDDS